MREEIIKAVNSLHSLFTKEPATADEIEKAEKKLGVKFAEDYKQLLMEFGWVESSEITLNTVSDKIMSNVVKDTEFLRETKLMEIPDNMYAICNFGIDLIFFLQDENGYIYEISPYTELRKINDSLVEFILADIDDDDEDDYDDDEDDYDDDEDDYDDDDDEDDYDDE